MGGAKATLCCGFLIYFFLQAAEKIHGTLSVGGGSEDRAFILPDDFQPAFNVSRMILMMFYQSSDHPGTQYRWSLNRISHFARSEHNFGNSYNYYNADNFRSCCLDRYERGDIITPTLCLREKG